MPRLAILIALLIALAMAACGDDSEGDVTPTTGDAETSTPTTSAETGTASSDEEEILAVTRQYTEGIVAKDWAAVCDARTEEEQASLGRQVGGSCEDAVQVIYDAPQFQNFGEHFADMEPEISISGNRAEVKYAPGVVILVTRDGDAWKLYEEGR